MAIQMTNASFRPRVGVSVRSDPLCSLEMIAIASVIVGVAILGAYVRVFHFIVRVLDPVPFCGNSTCTPTMCSHHDLHDCILSKRILRLP